MIKNIVFDMGNVLLRFEPELFLDRWTHDEQDRALLRREVFRSVEWAMMDRGTLDEPEAEARILPRLPERLHKAAKGLIEQWDEPMLPVEGMLELVQGLKAAGYRTYLLSNASHRQHIYSQKCEAIGLLDGKLISADVQLVKPDPQIYRIFLDRFGLKANECVFIDDTPINVEGAVHEGMEGIVFHLDAAELRQKLAALGVVF